MLKHIPAFFATTLEIPRVTWVHNVRNYCFLVSGLAIDLVCKMHVTESEAEYTSDYRGETFFFCAEPCKREFDAHPRDYLSGLLDIECGTMFCPRCGNRMRKLSEIDRILECVSCDRVGLPLRFVENAPVLPAKLRTMLTKCRICDSTMLADDQFCRTCGGRASVNFKISVVLS